MELVNALRSPDEQVQLNTMGTLRALAAAKEESRNIVANAGDLMTKLRVWLCLVHISRFPGFRSPPPHGVNRHHVPFQDLKDPKKGAGRTRQRHALATRAQQLLQLLEV